MDHCIPSIELFQHHSQFVANCVGDKDSIKTGVGENIRFLEKGNTVLVARDERRTCPGDLKGGELQRKGLMALFGFGWTSTTSSI
jgi:hypothetical protein